MSTPATSEAAGDARRPLTDHLKRLEAESIEIIREVAAAGMGVLLSSSEFEEICGLCNRVVVLSGGRDREVRDGAGLTPDVLLERCYRVASGGAEVTTSGPGPEQEN